MNIKIPVREVKVNDQGNLIEPPSVEITVLCECGEKLQAKVEWKKEYNHTPAVTHLTVEACRACLRKARN
jgi:hypothetical protein